MRKSAEAFRTISEVAEELKVPKHVLRFWEIKFPQIRPMKRGGGRRYYRPEDVELLSGIRALLHADGYTIKGVQKILKEQGADYAKSYGRGEAVANHDTGKANNAVKVATGRLRSPTLKAGQAKRKAAASASLPDVVANVIDELEACRDALHAAIPNKPSAKRRAPAAAR